ERLPLAARGAPRPRLPLQLHAAERVGLELIVDEVQSRLAVAGASVRRDLRPIERGGHRLLPRRAIARAIELLVLPPRAPPAEPAARVGDRIAQLRQRHRRIA